MAEYVIVYEVGHMRARIYHNGVNAQVVVEGGDAWFPTQRCRNMGGWSWRRSRFGWIPGWSMVAPAEKRRCGARHIIGAAWVIIRKRATTVR